MKKNYFLLFLAFFLIACSAKDIISAYNLSKCEYNFKSLSGLTFDGVPATKLFSTENFKKSLSLLSGNAESLPLDFLVNLNVENPNAAAASFSAFKYQIAIDNVDFAQGFLEKAFEVPAQGSQVLALPVKVDLKKLAKKENENTIMNIAKNLLGLEKNKMDLKVKLNPVYHFNGKEVELPLPVNLNFNVGK